MRDKNVLPFACPPSLRLCLIHVARMSVQVREKKGQNKKEGREVHPHRLSLCVSLPLGELLWSALFLLHSRSLTPTSSLLFYSTLLFLFFLFFLFFPLFLLSFLLPFLPSLTDPTLHLFFSLFLPRVSFSLYSSTTLVCACCCSLRRFSSGLLSSHSSSRIHKHTLTHLYSTPLPSPCFAFIRSLLQKHITHQH
ncbi:MAG: hypothetical protein JOS17DRAFT_185717 [Linnemannia elongata]|nr:MAG: hypothetical protein JOS17DRAFT_185717 [Linnemannia elongata]